VRMEDLREVSKVSKVNKVNKEENRRFVYSALRRPGQREPRLGQFTSRAVKGNGSLFILAHIFCTSLKSCLTE
jgi:uncharacterized protein YceH (UPF0502 family)